MLNLRKSIVGLVAALACSVGFLGAASTASAQAPYVWDDYSNSSPVYGLDSTSPGTTVEYWPNGTEFDMQCWVDNQNQRWFGGVLPNGEYMYSQAIYVGSQITVPAC